MCQICLKFKHPILHKKSETKWFVFNIHSKTDVRRVASFSPEQRKLLKTIVNSNEQCCETKKPMLSSSNDLIINQNTAIRKMTPNFFKHALNVPITPLVTTINALPLY